VLDAEVAWHVEFDRAPSRILDHHWPDVPNYGDVTKCDWASMPPVDIITGGSPCQDLSAAGRRAGMTEGTRSNLWVNMREAIATIRPRYVIWENVLGALSATAASASDMVADAGPLGNPGGGHLRALGRVLGDLAEIGYDARWTTVRASDVGAPHHRARVFLLATPSDAGRVDGRSTSAQSSRTRQGEPPSQPERHSPVPADSDRIGRRQGAEQPGAGAQEVAATVGDLGSLPGNGRADDLLVLPTPMAQHSGNTPENHLRKKPGRRQVTDLAILVENDLLATGGLLPTPRTTDSNGPGRHGQGGPDLRTAITEIGDDHASATESGPTEVLHDLRDGVLPQEVQRSTRRQDEVSVAEDMRSGVREQSDLGTGGLPPLASSTRHTAHAVSAVPVDGEPARSSQGPEPGEQRPGESGSSLRELPPQTALDGGPGTSHVNSHVPWGRYSAAIRRWESVLGRPAPAPTELNRNGKPHLNAEFASWMMGLLAGWVTAPEIGISRADQLKAIGNGVCPQQAAAAIRQLLAMDVTA